jgi:hypothetical protein
MGRDLITEVKKRMKSFRGVFQNAVIYKDWF